jgi:transposase
MSKPTPRYQRPERFQMRIDDRSLDQTLPPDHIARILWEFTCGVDLSALHQNVKAVEGRPGNPPIDPRILLTLWLLATVDGIASARQLDQLCTEHPAYLWVCGDVSVNHHTLSDFRSQNGPLFDRLITHSVAALLHEGLVALDERAQDGLRVRASAGAGSFRRGATLQECLGNAQQRVEALKAARPEGTTAQKRAADQRAAQERLERVTRAITVQEELATPHAKTAKKSCRKPGEARASTADADARRMKMADGGTRPAYNVELATTTVGGMIVGVDVVNAGTDHGLLGPMVEQVEQRFGRRPKRMIADGGLAQLEDIASLHEDGVMVYAPVKQPRTPGKDPHVACKRDTPGVAPWRVRMGTEEAKAIYGRRAQTAEWVNARFRNWGLRQFVVRGLKKVKAVASLFALVHNVVWGEVPRERAAPKSQE